MPLCAHHTPITRLVISVTAPIDCVTFLPSPKLSLSCRVCAEARQHLASVGGTVGSGPLPSLPIPQFPRPSDTPPAALGHKTSESGAQQQQQQQVGKLAATLHSRIPGTCLTRPSHPHYVLGGAITYSHIAAVNHCVHVGALACQVPMVLTHWCTRVRSRGRGTASSPVRVSPCLTTQAAAQTSCPPQATSTCCCYRWGGRSQI